MVSFIILNIILCSYTSFIEDNINRFKIIKEQSEIKETNSACSNAEYHSLIKDNLLKTIQEKDFTKFEFFWRITEIKANDVQSGTTLKIKHKYRH